MHVVSYYVKNKKSCINSFSFFKDTTPFDEYKDSRAQILLEGKRSRFTLLKDLRDKKLTSVEVNKLAAVIDGKHENYMIRI